MNNVLIHIGFPKTATTWLQQYVFPQWKAVNYVDHYQPENKWLLGLRYINELDFVPEDLAPKARNIIKAGKPTVISIESLAGDVFKRGFNTKRNALFLKTLFTEAKILITVRNQVSMIDSLYRQYVNQGGTSSFRKFIALPPPKPVSFDPTYLCYHRTVKLYRELFGNNNVIVAFYEQIGKEPLGFLNDLSAFLSIEPPWKAVVNRSVNKSMGSFGLALMRLANYFLISPMQPSNLVPGKAWHPLMRKFLQKNFPASGQKKSVLSKDERAGFEDFYRQSNRELAELTGLDPAQFGYPI